MSKRARSSVRILSKNKGASNERLRRSKRVVSTGWVAEHLNDPKVKLVEVDVDTSSYDKGHIKGAIGWNWQTQLCDNVRRDVIEPKKFAQLCSDAGIKPEDTVVFYGDNNNWF